MSPPVAVRERGREANPGHDSSAQLNASAGTDGTPDRTWLAELLRPLLAIRMGRWSH